VSSRNSFNAIQKFISESPGVIYCIGNWMEEKLMKTGTKSMIRSFENMKKLTGVLLEQNVKSILYFCGEEHRQELEEGFKKYFVKISKVITHKSRMIYPTVKSTFDAVFVFSPRSAESLLKNNSLSNQTIFACIGSTTAGYLKERGINNIFIPSHPDSRILLEEFYSQIQNPESRIQNPIP
jgi:uroporphyrinogen-III synthase